MSKIRKAVEDTESEQDIDSPMPITKKTFNTIIVHKDTQYEQCYKEGARILAAKKRAEELHKEADAAFDRERRAREIAEKQLESYKGKYIKNSPILDDLLKKGKENDELMQKNKQKLVDEYYEKYEKQIFEESVKKYRTK